MSLTILLALSLPLTNPTTCVNPVARDVESARRIAEREIVARPRPGRFILRIEQDREHWGSWRVWQSPLVMHGGRTPRGGGGISIRIDRCTGAVSDLHYQR